MLELSFFSRRQWEVEPNNLGGNEHCAMMYYSGVFADKNCDELAYYVCRTQQVGKKKKGV